jgi:hypothetical protein
MVARYVDLSKSMLLNRYTRAMFSPAALLSEPPKGGGITTATTTTTAFYVIYLPDRVGVRGG